MAPLRHQTFFSLGELNAALRIELERYNDQLPIRREQKGPLTMQVWEQIERAAATWNHIAG
jgi:hypothetical protein